MVKVILTKEEKKNWIQKMKERKATKRQERELALDIVKRVTELNTKWKEVDNKYTREFREMIISNLIS